MLVSWIWYCLFFWFASFRCEFAVAVFLLFFVFVRFLDFVLRVCLLFSVVR